MSYPPFLFANPATIAWEVRDKDEAPVVGAVVTATLWVNRSADDPVGQPGTKVPNMHELALADQGDGTYTYDVPANVIPAIGSNYVLVIDATVSGVLIRHWEEETAVSSGRIMLCSLARAKEWLGLSDSQNDEDKKLTRLITACSVSFMNAIRRPNFYKADDYDESSWIVNRRAGDVFVLNWPINSVTSVEVNGQTVPLLDPVVVNNTSYSLDLELAEEQRQMITLHGFWDSRVNVRVKYNGGYGSPPDDVQQAIAEWVAYKRGLAQLQAKDQTSQWVQLGQFQQNVSIATSTLKASEIDMPESVASCVSYYERPIVG